jgi:hypothetical protein
VTLRPDHLNTLFKELTSTKCMHVFGRQRSQTADLEILDDPLSPRPTLMSCPDLGATSMHLFPYCPDPEPACGAYGLLKCPDPGPACGCIIRGPNGKGKVEMTDAVQQLPIRVGGMPSRNNSGRLRVSTRALFAARMYSKHVCDVGKQGPWRC